MDYKNLNGKYHDTLNKRGLFTDYGLEHLREKLEISCRNDMGNVTNTGLESLITKVVPKMAKKLQWTKKYNITVESNGDIKKSFFDSDFSEANTSLVVMVLKVKESQSSSSTTEIYLPLKIDKFYYTGYYNYNHKKISTISDFRGIEVDRAINANNNPILKDVLCASCMLGSSGYVDLQKTTPTVDLLMVKY